MSEKEVIVCSHCKKENLEKSNFCRFCGEPLNEIAKDLQRERITTAQLMLLSNLVNNLEDTKSVTLIKKLIEKLDK